MGNSTSGGENDVHPGYLQHRRAMQDSAGTNTGTDSHQNRGIVNTGQVEVRTVPNLATTEEVRHRQRKSTSVNTETTLILAVKNGVSRNNSSTVEVIRAGISKEENNSSKELPEGISKPKLIKPPSTKYAYQQSKTNKVKGQQSVPDDVKYSSHVEIDVSNARQIMKEGNVDKQTPERKSGVLQSSGSKSQEGKMESGIEDTPTTSQQLGKRGTEYQGLTLIESKPTLERMNGSQKPELDVNRLQSQLQSLEDENLKLQHENKALRTMVDELTTRYLPEYSRRRRQSDSVRKADDLAEMVKQYSELYNKEWMTCKRMLDRISPLGRGPKYEDCQLRFLCDVIVVAYETTRRVVQVFEDKTTTVLLNGIRYTSNKNQDESSPSSVEDPYSTMVKHDEELQRALKVMGERSLNFVRLLSQKCPLDDIVQRVNRELKEDWSSVLTPAVEHNTDLKNYIEKSCRLTYQMNTLRPPVRMSYNEKRFVALHHDPVLGTTMSAIKKGIVDFHIWPALVDHGNNVLVKGKVQLD
ncbi:uncharacterized protein LOC144447205 [Glandiceps talaboti]